MILADMVRRIDSETGIVVCDSEGKEIVKISDHEIVHNPLFEREIIFPIRAIDSTIEVWVEDE